MTDTFYAANHEWVQMDDDGLAAIGLTARALGLAAAVLAVELPEPGRNVAKGEACGLIKTETREYNARAPFSGTITEHNANLRDRPALLETAPETTWLFKMRLADPTALAGLMSRAAYDAMA